MRKVKIVTIGGGTGSFTVLSGLKKYPFNLSAIVGMTDDGGSTGVLRDEYGVLPPGDVRQCLVALAGESTALRRLFAYRYVSGSLAGHNFGNLFLSTLEKTSGNFARAVSEAGRILNTCGRVIPVTLKNTRLAAELKNGRKIFGQYNIQGSDLTDLKRLYLRPRASVNPVAVRAVREADIILVNPGDLYSSLIPNFLADGFACAVRQAGGKRIYLCNLMTQTGQTDGYGVADFVRVLENYIGPGALDIVIYNTARPSANLIRKYHASGNELVLFKPGLATGKTRYIGARLFGRNAVKPIKGDKIVRSYVRHDSQKVARLIRKIANREFA